MIDDFWIPRREGGRGTEITTLPAGQNLGELDDIKYFQRKLYNCLHVPVGRLENTATFNSARATEINKEEIKFFKFVQRLRNRFSILFIDLLKKQLILKRIVTPEEWDSEIANEIYFDYKKDSYFMEFNDSEIMKNRMEVAKEAVGLGEDYFSKDYIKKHILKLTEEEVDQIEVETGVEKEDEKENTETGAAGVEGETTPEATPPEETQ